MLRLRQHGEALLQRFTVCIPAPSDLVYAQTRMEVVVSLETFVVFRLCQQKSLVLSNQIVSLVACSK